MELGLEGKIALITGASRGIGKAIAESLAREGCHLVLVSRNEAELAAARGSISAIAPNASIRICPADLREPKAIASIVQDFGDVDILVNNAGAIPHGGLLDVTDDAWLDGWQLKVFGHIRMTRGLYAVMKARGSGVIVNVIGYAGERLLASYIAGSSGNAALIAFTKAVGAVSPADGIRVVGVNPGPILTERLQNRLKKRAEDELGAQHRWRELMRDFPFGRAGGPAEIADTVAFLASARAGYITGTVINVDGGMSNRPIST